MTPPPGHIRPDGRGGLRVVIEEVEHWFAPVDVTRTFCLRCTRCGMVEATIARTVLLGGRS